MSSDTYSRFCPAARKIERRSVSHAQIQVVLLGINAESRRSRNHRHVACGATSLSKSFDDQFRVSLLDTEHHSARRTLAACECHADREREQ
jgi:hypothetical protein